MAVRIQVALERGYLLHRRAYRETSVLADVFTENHGRVGVIAKGARRPRSPMRLGLQAFRPLLFSWQGRGELMTLTASESVGSDPHLSGVKLASAFYANELLVRLIQRNDPNPMLFFAYEQLLVELRQDSTVEPPLRRFEKHLLDALGYGLELENDTQGRPISPRRRYLYVPETGPVALDADHEETQTTVSGATLAGLARDELCGAELDEAKRLMRHILAQYLGDKPLKSRELLRVPRQRD